MHSRKTQLPNVIAVVGCDGSGKSTLTSDLAAHFNRLQTTELLYLGQSSGNIGNWIKRLPIIGTALGRYLDHKAKQAHKDKTSPPDTLTVIVIYLLSLWRVHKFRRMLALSRRGTLIITDRYPQAEKAGFYFDGTGLDPATANAWLARKLAARELRLYQWMASYIPTLIIRLNIDIETAHARKPDHKRAMLQQKITTIPTLHFNSATIVDLNSLDPYEQVLQQALKAVDLQLAK
ncbi:MAG: hypothetical protein P1P93_00350 [Gammaproteobacteria bacterium]|nr:hypothetical protein [Gammaproteobacteria bacterium]